MNAQQRYNAMRAEGLSHNLAEMFALQAPPGVMTDNVFLEGHCNGSQFERNPGLGNLYAAEARANGIDPKGKVYLSGLARYPGDPEAWVSGRGDVQRVCEKRGWGCQGAVNVQSADADTAPEEVAIAPDIVDAKVAQILDTVPDRAHVDVADLRAQVADKLTPKWKDTPNVASR